MCEPNRRCDRPSCPCNEPDTELKDALTRMRERFPAPWMTEVSEYQLGWKAFAFMDRYGDMEIAGSGYGPTPHAAVDAAIKAHDDMVKADALFQVLKAECEAERDYDERRDGATYNERDTLAERVANARDATDKAGALR